MGYWKEVRGARLILLVVFDYRGYPDKQDSFEERRIKVKIIHYISQGNESSRY